MLLQMLAKTLTSNSTTMKRKLIKSQHQNPLEVVPFWGMALWPFQPRPHVLIEKRPLPWALQFLKYQSFLCIKLGMIEFVKFGPRLVYWPPTLTGNINFQLKIGKNICQVWDSNPCTLSYTRS